MIFNSFHFLLFFPIVTLIYFIVPKKIRYIWLLLASYYFYMCWNVKYVLLLLISTVTTWIAGWIIRVCHEPVGKKLAVAGCVSINLGLLFCFKYVDFLVDICNGILSIFHVKLLENSFDVLLPVGISFYTFQALGYIIDVYRGRIEPEKNILRYALFVSFFPQLVAGPIERSENLLGQINGVESKSLWNYENVTDGLTLMLWGLFVKMVIADRVAILVNTVFEQFNMYGTVVLIAGAIGFAIQIYCDFMGYSTIALGAAKVMGFTLMENFDTPYLSHSISDFWRRWHISLSTWFRDYVYIPLGGNRCRKLRKYFNVILTMGISGLWHGANWTFVIWGLLHGLYQVLEELLSPLKEKVNNTLQVKTESFSYKLMEIAVTFMLVDFAWIFFRADSVNDALIYCKRLFTKCDPWSLFNGAIYELGLDRFEFQVLMVSLLALVLSEFLHYFKGQSIVMFLKEQCIWFRWLVLFILIFSILVYGIYGIQFESSQFIYFQF